MSRHYDVIIIGSGAGGGTLAKALADTGKSILILERGEVLPVEADNWSSTQVFVKKKYRTKEQWLDKDGKPFVPNTHYWVGGNTSFYGAALMRMKKRDFEAVQHAGGVSPAWPISYDEMAPWYQKSEALWQVRGQRGVVAGASSMYQFTATSCGKPDSAVVGTCGNEATRLLSSTASGRTRFSLA